MGKFSTRSSIAIAFLILIWSISWSIYKIALPYTPPILFAGMRALIGGVLLAIFLIPTWKKIKWRENWIRYCLSALLNAILFYGFQTIGLMYLPGGLFSVLVYFQPVLIGLFAWVWLGEQMSRLKIIGLIVGFLGILTISTDGLTGEVSITGVIIALLTAITWALGTIYVKKESKQVDSLWMIALQFTIGGAILTSIGAGVEGFSNIIWSREYLFGLGFGATFGIPIAFVLYFTLINSGDASSVASFTFLVPLIAVLVGTVFMNEPFSITLFAGLILIILSIGFVNYSGESSNKQVNTMERTKEIG
ncbi:DMT family transporter [Domibacillus aminovorans]|uniref:EamA domain-containing protein n=1 Tax=Domibacillus aminovorans TaxID=29332 RepID=A0A177LAX6_9BACI|nr:DMT family transporter [Domibacillus aminovorans]OAH62442.1 hypothetical protein AWH49_09620 [Domibacillus aminovorans]